MNKNIFIPILFGVLFLSQISYGQVATNSEASYKISIEKKVILPDFELDTMDISINSMGQPLKGFAFKIAVQTQYFTIEEIIPAKFYNDCGWEFYNVKQMISDFSAENYLQVWQFIGLSEIFSDSISPSCYATETKLPLAKVVISRNQFTRSSESVIPIFFLWENCSDNTISGMSGNDLFVSDKIFQYDENQPQFQKNKFPTTLGIPETCTKPSALNAPVKKIDFYNGGVVLKDIIGEDSLILNK